MTDDWLAHQCTLQDIHHAQAEFLQQTRLNHTEDDT